MKIETERLQLREFTLDDFEAFADLMADPEVRRYSVTGILDREQSRQYLQKILDHYQQYGYGRYVIIDKRDNAFIGYAGFIVQEIENIKRTELAFALKPAYWGQGFAFEATSALCDHAFKILNLPELISIIDVENQRSISLAKRLGMHLEKDFLFHQIQAHLFVLWNR